MLRSNAFVRAAGGTNLAGTRPAGTEAKITPEPEGYEKVGGLRDARIPRGSSSH